MTNNGNNGRRGIKIKNLEMTAWDGTPIFQIKNTDFTKAMAKAMNVAEKKIYGRRR